MVFLFKRGLNHARSMIRGSLSGVDEAALVFRPENCVVGNVSSRISKAFGDWISL